MKEVSIIIPTLNEAETIGKLIDSLNRDSFPSEEKEILVIDGGSADKTVEIAQEKGAKVVKEKGEKSPSNARNQGARESEGDILLFLEGDTDHVSRDFITNAVKHFRDDDVIGVKWNFLPAEDTLPEKIIGAYRNTKAANFTRKKQLSGWYPNFLKKRAFNEIGGFPALGYGEDRVFREKLENYLWDNPEKKIVHEGKLKVFGHGIHSFAELFKQRSWYGRTILPYLEEVNWEIWEVISLVTLPAYIFSIISAFLILLSPWFLIPAALYFGRLLTLIFESIRHRNKYCLLVPLIDLIGGTGFMIGLLQRLSGEKSYSRG